MADETRPLAGDDRALFDWFFDRWPELASLPSVLALDASAEVFEADEGYRTLSVPYLPDAARPILPSPYPGEGRGEIEGHPFEVLLFVGDHGAMVEVIWSAGTWPRRLPRPDELEACQRT